MWLLWSNYGNLVVLLGAGGNSQNQNWQELSVTIPGNQQGYIYIGKIYRFLGIKPVENRETLVVNVSGMNVMFSLKNITPPDIGSGEGLEIILRDSAIF